MQPITIRFPDAVYEGLRERSFETRESMNALAVQSVHAMLGISRENFEKWLAAHPVPEDK